MLRVVLKLSGEYLGGEKQIGFDNQAIDSITNQIITVHNKGIQITVVVGGGNFFRGASKQDLIDRKAGDNIGMLATIMNGLFLQSTLEKKGKETRLLTSIEVNKLAEPYISRRAIRHLNKNRIVICVAGLGIPNFSTDTASVVRAKELEADLMIKGTMVDGVYERDPKKFKDAKKFTSISYRDVLQKNIEVMDNTAITFSKDHDVPLYVLQITNSQDLISFFQGEKPGTSILASETDDRIEKILKKI